MLTTQNAHRSQDCTLLEAVAAAAHKEDDRGLRALRQQLGYDGLDDKGRLALFRALRRKVKLAGSEETDLTRACLALEGAFPVPYKSVKEHAEAQSLRKAFMRMSLVSQHVPPAVSSEIACDSDSLCGDADVVPTAQAHAARLPEGWVRLRAMDGCLDVPKDILKGAGFFEALVNSSMQGGRDAGGAYMVDADLQSLQATIHWLKHDSLPDFTALQARTLRTKADAWCLPKMSDYLTGLVRHANDAEKLVAAQEAVTAKLGERFEGDPAVTSLPAISQRAFRVMATILRRHLTEGDVVAKSVTINVGDTMLGKLRNNISNLFVEYWKPAYQAGTFLDDRQQEMALNRAALACEEMLNKVGYCVTECSGSAATNEITFRLLR